MTKRVRWVLAGLSAVFLVGIATTGGALYYAWELLHRPFRAYANEHVQIQVPRGTDARTILDNLESKGVLANSDLARIYLVYQLGDPPLQAGEYRFEGTLSVPEVLDQMIRGDVVTYPVTIIEGLTLHETAFELAKAGFGEQESFESLMHTPELIADLDPAATDLEGYLFPDTYRFAGSTSEAEIVAVMVRNFRRQWNTEVVPIRDQDDGRSIRELVILASIVEKEARLDDERPIIAGVYRNRLDRNIALYADPTIIYALKRDDRWDGNLRRKDLDLDSPYNTYIHPGLTPGPIASPGLASLQAAAQPAEVPYIYFVSRNDGSHVFAETLSEHNRNVHTWQKLYWRNRWAEEKKQKSEPTG